MHIPEANNLWDTYRTRKSLFGVVTKFLTDGSSPLITSSSNFVWVWQEWLHLGVISFLEGKQGSLVTPETEGRRTRWEEVHRMASDCEWSCFCPLGHVTSEPPLPWKPFLEAAVLIQQWTYRTALTQVLVLRHTNLQIPRFTENALPDLWTRMRKSPWSWEQSTHSASDKGFSDRSSPQVCFYFVVSEETGPGSTFQLRAMLTSWA